MDATPIDFSDIRPLDGRQLLMGIIAPSACQLGAHASMWTAIHEAAATVATLAGVDRERIAVEIQRGLGVEITSAPARAEPMQDLAELLRRGISALLSAHVSGGAPRAAALALWCEFLEARSTLLRLDTVRPAAGNHR